MKITVVGTGYVGLVTGTCLAESGNQVICVDNDARKIEQLESGKIPIYEPGLEELVDRNVKGQRLSFTTDLKSAVAESTITFIAVGTPQADDGSCDLTAVKVVAGEIAEAMTGPQIVVNKSTVPVGTAELVTGIIQGKTSHPVEVVSNPEFLKEGAAIDDFMKPDRVVIGTNSEEVARTMKELYSPFVRTGKPLMVMDPPSAELTKYASNAMLATKISFMNELSRLSEKVGADISKVRQGMGADQRIGPHFLFPGVGYGGSCFPKDIRALSHLGQENGVHLEILAAVDSVNDSQKRVLSEKVVARFGEDLSGHKFAFWGLAFKPKTDDMREAPSIVLAEELVTRGAKVCAHDPEALHTGREAIGDSIEYSEDPYLAAEGASALLLITEWNEYRGPDFERLRSLLKEPVIFDGRNIWNMNLASKHDFEYFGIGMRGSSDAKK
ncbi:MAG: UDP-glucose dehydrogenase family protein [Planctomycetota bacterium]